jgi:subtilisin family serine protease
MIRLAVTGLCMLLGLSGCGNGKAGGPEEAAAKQVTVIAPNNATDAVEPYRHKSGYGNASFELALSKGINLIDFSQVSFYEIDKEHDAVLTIRDENNSVEAFITTKSKNTLSEQSAMQPLYLDHSGVYHFQIEMPDSRDNWKVLAVHKTQLDHTLQSSLKEPVTIEKTAGSDALYPYQWHLKNTAQHDFVLYDAVAGNDINVEPVWQMGYTGKGVSVAVIDQGVEINHPDLIGNIDIHHCWNYLNNSYDTTPASSANAHGTAVAGIIAAKAYNGIGGRGVAPEATLVSYNMLESQEIVDWSLALDSLVRGVERVDIYNNSWGIGAGTLYPNPSYEDSIYKELSRQMAYGVKFGREGKGAIYIKSAGNDRIKFNEERLDFENNWNANFDPEQVDRYAIIVGASNADGHYSEYSNPGANLLINAPGGDSNAPYLELDLHQIVTTDLSGMYAGYDIQEGHGIDYHFDAKGNENFDYTDRMNGTSAAGPIVAGVVALMLEANPNLTWRDVRYILATTATKNGSGYSVNGAGHTFSNDYGFGRVNAQDAVEAAIHWNTLVPEQRIVKSASAFATTQTPANGRSIVNINKDLLVEYVNVQFSLKEIESETIAFSQIEEGNLPQKLTGFYNAAFKIDNLDGKGAIDVYLDCEHNRSIKIMQAHILAGAANKKVEIPIDLNEKCQAFYEIKERETTENNSTTWSLELTKGAPMSKASDIEVTLISPSKTSSVLVSAPNGLSDDSLFIGTRVGSNAFLDEHSQGEWIVQIREVETPDALHAFRAENITVEIYGREP